MGKAEFKKSEEASVDDPKDSVPVPQLTFTEAEHEDMVKFLNFINTHGTFTNINLRQSHDIAQLNIKAINVIKKIENHIFEIKRVTGTRKD